MEYSKIRGFYNIYYNGLIYNGEFKSGLFDGNCNSLEFANKDKYIGLMKQSKFHGKG